MTDMFGWLRKLGEVAGTLYLFGYIPWAFHAWRENLGWLPILESQYLLAGVVPTMIFWLVYAGIRFGPGVSITLHEWIQSFKNSTWRPETIFRWVAIAGMILFGILAPASHSLEEAFPAIAMLVHAFAIILLILPMIALTFLFPWTSYWDRYLTLIGSGILALIVYVSYIHPVLPQELGGASPRCAYLDIVTAEVSDTTFKEVVDTDRVRTETAVVRSKRINILFSGTDFMLIRHLAEKQGTKTKVYDIKKSVVRVVTWCD